MIIISTGQVILGTASLATLLSLVQWLLATWIKARLEKSIQYEYDERLEDYKFSQLQRQKAEVIAQLFARWIKYLGKEQDYLDKKALIDYYEELNQMSLELSLWIPDEEILNNIMARLSQGSSPGDAKDIRTLTGQIRKMILGNKDDGFDSSKITLWENKIKYIVNAKGGPPETD